MLLALIVIVNQSHNVDFVTTIIRTFASHLVINAGLMITERLEFRYRALNHVIDFAWSTVVVIIIWVGLGWFEFTTIWVLLAISLVVHFIIFILEMHRSHSEIAEINKLIKEKRR